MILGDVFQRFVEDSPVSVMAQALLENALPPSVVDDLFAQHAHLQYTRDLLFSDVVNLMSLVVCRIRPSINSAFDKMADRLTVTKKAVYDKIDRVETSTSAALVRHSGAVFTKVVDALGGAKIPGFRGTARGSSTAATCPAPSTGSHRCGRPVPGHCPVSRWSSSIPRRCWSSM